MKRAWVARGNSGNREAPKGGVAATPTSPRKLPASYQWWLVAATPLLVLISHYIAVLPHEFAHSFAAWLLGVKADPLNIDWGGSTLANLLLLVHIDENVDYAAIFAAHAGWKVAVIAAAGPVLANGGMYVVFRWILLLRADRWSPVAGFLLLWLVLMNLANLYDYVPLRTFTPESDVEHFLLGTGISPWTVYVLGGYLVLAVMIDFFKKVLPTGLGGVGIAIPPLRASILMVCTAIMFGYFAIPALLENDDVTRFMGGTSLALGPIVLVLAWRTVTAVPSPSEA